MDYTHEYITRFLVPVKYVDYLMLAHFLSHFCDFLDAVVHELESLHNVNCASVSMATTL